MRKEVLLTVYSGSDKSILQSLHDDYENKGINVQLNGGFMKVRLYDDAPEFEYLLNEISHMNLKYGYNEFRDYTKAELQLAKYFAIGLLPYPYEHTPEKNADYFGTMYDAGRDCIETRKQISCLHLDVKKFSKYHISSIIPERIISAITKEEFEANNYSGITYGNVVDYKGREMDKLYQLLVNTELPSLNLVDVQTELPLRKNVTYVEKSYHSNKLEGVYPRTDFVYCEDAFKEAFDFYLTKEWFWGGNYRSQTLIVSKRVYDWFKQTRIKLMIEPVRII